MTNKTAAFIATAPVTQTLAAADELDAEAVWCMAHNPAGTPLTAATAHRANSDCVDPHYAGVRVAEAGTTCDGGSRRCEGMVTVPEHVAAARTGDLYAFPYCAPCRVAAAADTAADEPVQGPEPAPEPRVWEAPDEPTGVDIVHTHDQQAGEPIIWTRTLVASSSRWARADRPDERYSWSELLDRGPVIEGRPEPEYGIGIYRTRGSLRWITPDGTTRKSPEIPPGVLVAVTAVTERSGEPTLRVMRADGDHGLVLTRQFHEAGPDRL